MVDPPELLKAHLAWVTMYKQNKDAGLTGHLYWISRLNLRKWTKHFEEKGEQRLQSKSRFVFHYLACAPLYQRGDLGAGKARKTLFKFSPESDILIVHSKTSSCLLTSGRYSMYNSSSVTRARHLPGNPSPCFGAKKR